MFENRENGNGNGMETTIYMGKNTTIKGDLHFEGTGRIDGTVEGKVTVRGTLTLGPEGKVSTLMEGDHLIIGGRVDGRIVAHIKVELLPTAVVQAEIVAPTITMEEGAVFNGKSRMPEGHEPKGKGSTKEELAVSSTA
ncbi:MAG TPA: polymer-forming cytoskeletal protein [Nitrospiria bacterium]